MSSCNSHDYKHLYFPKSIIENCFIKPYVEINYSLSLSLSLCTTPPPSPSPSPFLSLSLSLQFTLFLPLSSIHSLSSSTTLSSSLSLTPYLALHVIISTFPHYLNFKNMSCRLY